MSAPRLVVLAGPNGAGKSTFYRSQLQDAALPFVNADEFAGRIGVSTTEAATVADRVRSEWIGQRTSFITETVFSDPVGAKLKFLHDAVDAGYRVTLVFIGLASVELSEARVIGRVAEGGHDVPSERLPRRYQQSLLNLKEALKFVPEVLVYDNSSAQSPFELVLHVVNGKTVARADPLPAWLAGVAP